MPDRRTRMPTGPRSTAEAERLAFDPNIRVQISAPQLVRIEFERLKEEPTPQEIQEVGRADIQFRFARFARERLGVELSLRSQQPNIMRYEVAYRAVFEITDASKETDFEHEFKGIAAFVATSTLYPFLREALTSTFQRAGMPGATLPLVNFRELVDPQTLNVPVAPG